MYLNRVFELSMVLDSDKFDEVFSEFYGGDDYADEDEYYVDRSLSPKGITVKYRASQYKKKVRLIADAAAITGGAITDADKLVRKLEKHIDKYFDSNYQLEDFTVSGLTLTTAIDVGSRENVSAYLKVIQRIGKVKGFSPASFECLDDDDSNFCLRGNSNGIDFLLYDLEQVAASQMEIAESSQKYKGILRVEVRLTKPKAIQKYSVAYGTAEQIIDLSERCQDVFMSVFVRVVPFGAFYKKKEAAEIICSKISDNVLRRRMLKLLALIPEKKSLLLAQKAMAYRHPDELLVEFAKINLSPVTISKRQDIKQLNNLYDLL